MYGRGGAETVEVNLVDVEWTWRILDHPQADLQVMTWQLPTGRISQRLGSN